MSVLDDRTIVPTQRARLREALDHVELFAGVEPGLLDALALQFRSVDVPAETVVVRQGDRSDRFYVVDRGELEVSATVGAGVARLGLVRPGEFFGEIGILRGSPRTATVMAITPVSLWTLTAGALLEWLAAAPDAAKRLYDVMRRRELANAFRALQ